ncbi:hypothetical protein MRX96_033101 [Rhipicephalus microplus]
MDPFEDGSRWAAIVRNLSVVLLTNVFARSLRDHLDLLLALFAMHDRENLRSRQDWLAVDEWKKETAGWEERRSTDEDANRHQTNGQTLLQVAAGAGSCRDSMRPMDPVMEAGPTTVSASCRETLVRRDVTEEPSSPSSASASCSGSDDPTCYASNS